ncbi:MAG: extracellular solute-binding protein [Deinococcota bacterium]
MTIQLKGITWDHSRGLIPLVATAQRFWEIHGVDIIWQKRSLHDFGEYPLQKLVDRFDLLIIDHPFVGYAASHPILEPLDTWLSQEYLQHQAANSIGKSHESYVYGGHQWALATDAATPIASYRPDLLAKYDLELPTTWAELKALAKTGRVIVPNTPLDALMNFSFLCASLEPSYLHEDAFVSEEVGLWALEELRELIADCPADCLGRNPIQTYDALAEGESAVYCPLGYGYSNYGRAGYGAHKLAFTNVVSVQGNQGRSVLGGTGLAISSFCQYKDIAAQYVQYVNDAHTQSTLYVENGGQPGHRSAWTSNYANQLTNNFFKHTLATLDNAYLRPRYDGYLHFQDNVSQYVHAYVNQGGNPKTTLATMQTYFAASKQGTDALTG